LKWSCFGPVHSTRPRYYCSIPSPTDYKGFLNAMQTESQYLANDTPVVPSAALTGQRCVGYWRRTGLGFAAVADELCRD